MSRLSFLSFMHQVMNWPNMRHGSNNLNRNMESLAFLQNKFADQCYFCISSFQSYAILAYRDLNLLLREVHGYILQERWSYVLPNLDSFRPNGITNNKMKSTIRLNWWRQQLIRLLKNKPYLLVLMTHSISLSNAHRCLP